MSRGTLDALDLIGEDKSIDLLVEAAADERISDVC